MMSVGEKFLKEMNKNMGEKEKIDEIEDIKVETGKDINELFATQETKEKVITYNNKVWVFHYRELTWAEKNKIISQATVMDRNKEAHFEVDKYLRLSFLKMELELNGHKLTAIELVKLDEKVGNLLEDIVPKAQEIINKEEEDFLEP